MRDLFAFDTASGLPNRHQRRARATGLVRVAIAAWAVLVGFLILTGLAPSTQSAAQSGDPVDLAALAWIFLATCALSVAIFHTSAELRRGVALRHLARATPALTAMTAAYVTVVLITLPTAEETVQPFGPAVGATGEESASPAQSDTVSELI